MSWQLRWRPARISPYGAATLHVCTFAKDQFAPHRGALPTPPPHVPCAPCDGACYLLCPVGKLDHGEECHALDGSDLAVLLVTAAAVHDGLDGLSCLRKIFKARPCVNWSCMIDADVVGIGHVSGSRQLGRVLHEVITFTILDERLLESCTL